MRTMGAVVGSVGALLLVVWACGGKSPTQPTPPPATCAFTLSTSALSFGQSGGNAAVTVSTTAQCAWTAASDRGWMTIGSGASGSGPGTVNVSVTANSGADARTGTLTVAGQSVAVRQDASVACTIAIAPSSASFSKDAATGTFAVTTASSCPWSATTGASWVTVTSGASGTGNGTVAFSVARNTAVDARSSVIHVGDATFSISQAGDTGLCEFRVSPVTINVCMSPRYDLITTMTTGPSCGWTVTSDTPWITLTGGTSRHGSEDLHFNVGDNYDAPRLGVVKIRWDSPTAGQNIQVSQAGCRYSVSVTSVSVVAAGGTDSVLVYQQSDPLECGGPLQDGCRWTATTSAPWITITSPATQSGDGRVTFVTAPNSGAARSATISIRDKTIVVSQAGI